MCIDANRLDKAFMRDQLNERALQLKSQYRLLVSRKDRYAVKTRSELTQQINLCFLLLELLEKVGCNELRLGDRAFKAFERLTEPRRLKRNGDV